MKLVVRGKDIRQEPLLETEEARSVEILDSQGQLVAVMHKMFDTEYWGISTIQDSDWENVKKKLGYTNKTPELEASRRKDFFKL